jgi:alcohol dehydrogenase (NADP+)
MAQRYQCSPAQILISYHISRGDSVIPKAVQTQHLQDNLMAAQLTLSDQDISTLSELNKDYRFINGHFFDCPEQGYGWVFAD